MTPCQHGTGPGHAFLASYSGRAVLGSAGRRWASWIRVVMSSFGAGAGTRLFMMPRTPGTLPARCPAFWRPRRGKAS